MDLVTVGKIHGHFDWFHPDNKEISYKFYGLPEAIDKMGSIIVDADNYDTDLEIDLNENYLAIDFARDLLSRLKKRFLCHGGIKTLECIIQYLENNKEEQEKLMIEKLHKDAVKKKDDLSRQIISLDKRIEFLNDMISEFE